MKTFLSLVAVAFFTVTSVYAIIYVPPVEELVPTAEVVVVGTLKQGKDVDGFHRGTIAVEKVLHGKDLEAGGELEVRWKAKPKNLAPGLAHTADYTFAPQLEKKTVFVIQPREEKEKDKPYLLNWGSQYPEENEGKIQKLVAKARP